MEKMGQACGIRIGPAVMEHIGGIPALADVSTPRLCLRGQRRDGSNAVTTQVLFGGQNVVAIAVELDEFVVDVGLGDGARRGILTSHGRLSAYDLGRLLSDSVCRRCWLLRWQDVPAIMTSARRRWLVSIAFDRHARDLVAVPTHIPCTF